MAPNWRRAEVLREYLLAMFPTLPQTISADKVRVWLGHRPSMPDGRTCIGTSRKTPDVIYAFGRGHVGVVVTCLWSFIRAELESSLLIPLLLGVEQ